MRSIVIAPGATPAGTDIPLPGRLERLVSAQVYDPTSGPTALTVVETTPASGEIYLSTPGTVQLGTALTATQQVILVGVGVGEAVARTVRYIGA